MHPATQQVIQQGAQTLPQLKSIRLWLFYPAFYSPCETLINSPYMGNLAGFNRHFMTFMCCLYCSICDTSFMVGFQKINDMKQEHGPMQRKPTCISTLHTARILWPWLADNFGLINTMKCTRSLASIHCQLIRASIHPSIHPSSQPSSHPAIQPSTIQSASQPMLQHPPWISSDYGW